MNGQAVLQGVAGLEVVANLERAIVVFLQGYLTAPMVMPEIILSDKKM